MTKDIYMGRPSDHVNQRLANLVIDEQLPIWDKNNLRKYKIIYPMSKTWIFFESKFKSPIPQQLTPSIKAKINLINDWRQQSFTPEPANVTLNPANSLGLTPPIEALLVQIPLVPASPTLVYPIQVPKA